MFGGGEGSKIDRTLAAAAATRATILHKGADTVIAARNEARVLAGTSPWLSTAGTGDVLAGILAAQVAQDRKPLPSLRYRVGAVQRLTLTSAVPAAWEGQPVVDETGEYDLSPMWGERVEAVP